MAVLFIFFTRVCLVSRTCPIARERRNLSKLNFLTSPAFNSADKSYCQGKQSSIGFYLFNVMLKKVQSTYHSRETDWRNSGFRWSFARRVSKREPFILADPLNEETCTGLIDTNIINLVSPMAMFMQIFGHSFAWRRFAFLIRICLSTHRKYKHSTDVVLGTDQSQPTWTFIPSSSLAYSWIAKTRFDQIYQEPGTVHVTLSAI